MPAVGREAFAAAVDAYDLGAVPRDEICELALPPSTAATVPALVEA